MQVVSIYRWLKPPVANDIEYATEGLKPSAEILVAQSSLIVQLCHSERSEESIAGMDSSRCSE